MLLTTIVATLLASPPILQEPVEASVEIVLPQARHALRDEWPEDALRGVLEVTSGGGILAAGMELRVEGPRGTTVRLGTYLEELADEMPRVAPTPGTQAAVPLSDGALLVRADERCHFSTVQDAMKLGAAPELGIWRFQLGVRRVDEQGEPLEGSYRVDAPVLLDTGRARPGKGEERVEPIPLYVFAMGWGSGPDGRAKRLVYQVSASRTEDVVALKARLRAIREAVPDRPLVIHARPGVLVVEVIELLDLVADAGYESFLFGLPK